MARRSYNGGAVPSLTTTLLNPTDLVVSINPTTNWPTGGASGEFNVIINPGLPTEEHALGASLSGGTITFASVAKRGVDGTSAQTHPVGSVIIHGDAAYEADEANRHINDPAQAVIEHSTLLDATRHAAVTHTAGMLGTDSVGSDEIQANAVGSSELADNAVDTAAIVNLAVTAGKIANTTITAAQIANDTITATQIAANAITASELADNAVDTNAILDNAVTLAKMADNSVSTAEIVAASVTLAKFASEASTAFVPVWVGSTVTLGTGSSYGQYFKLGRLVFGIAGFRLGVGGNVTGTPIGFNLPGGLVAADFDTGGASTGWITAARAFDVSANAVFSGLGIVGTSSTTAYATAGTSANWDDLTPFNWDNGDVFASLFVFEATA
jgi:hypothetical protein